MPKSIRLLIVVSVLVGFVLVLLPPLVLLLEPSEITTSQKLRWVQSIAATVLSFIAVVTSAGAVLIARADRAEDRGLSVYDDFWFRSALFPGLYQELRQLVDRNTHVFENNRVDFDLDEFDYGLRKVRNRCSSFILISETFVNDANSILDGLENYVHFEVELSKGVDLGEMDREENELDFEKFERAMLALLHDTHQSVIPNDR